MFPERVPVLVVGGGTVGLSAALFLARQGVQPLVVERHAGVATHPRATGVGLRTVEFFRQHGIEEAFLAAVPRASGTEGKVVARTLAEADLDEVGWTAPPPDYGDTLREDISPAHSDRRGSCPQDRIDQVLLTAARQHGADLRNGVELVALEQEADVVVATLRERSSGAQHVVRADYVIAADGSGSPVRRTLGIGTTGPGSMGVPMVNIYFQADLTHLVKEHVPIVCEITTPEAPGNLMAINYTNRWVFHTSYDPERGQRAEDFTTERCLELVRAAIGVPDLRVEILSTLPWQVAGRLADRFRDGRVFLVGDAAHVVPPIGAFGLNTGIADVHNLAWKLVAVLEGWAGTELLDSYEAERRPVARFALDQALLRMRRPDLHWNPDGAAERAVLGMASALVVHLGYRYDSTAVVGADTELPSLEDVQRDLDGSPGSRVPHSWVWRSGRRVSTMDLVGSEFTVLAGADGHSWCAAAEALGLTAYRVGQDGVVVDRAGGWQDKAGIGADGAVLVRPDGFVAWRASAASDEPERELDEALSQVLSRVSVAVS
ncbi:FAD-dependent oxidoreductase [Solihabitans fulvus]|uniref:FAD-dependent oxidoreductase n=1 Tax=Solihabitans fulvus TaxID=1892852 RepID=A0A5B2XC12_9PSEU|nr:FAD-dependent oxidoreductase [Solihabitans fulvus]KAA2260725.1 FAD-dependent oxidoreductase [Solihabitans fulvus]